MARALGAKLGLPVIHLDTLFWKPGWVEGDPIAFRAAVDTTAVAERWLSDGVRTPYLWLEPPTPLCLWRVVRRALMDRASSGKTSRPAARTFSASLATNRRERR